MPRRNEQPTDIGFKSQEGDCGLQESDWSPGGDGGAVDILESCSMEDESYFAALIRMYGRSLEFVSSLPPAERATYIERLDKLRSRGRRVGWGIEEELNSLWCAATLDQGE
jgi:hypothetical protein